MFIVIHVIVILHLYQSNIFVNQLMLQASATVRGRGTDIGLVETRRGRGTATGSINETGIGVDVDGFGPSGWGRGTRTGVDGRGRGTASSVAGGGRGRGTGVVATATDVLGVTGGVKRPRKVGMGILHTQSGFTIHNISCLKFLHLFQL